MFSPLSDVSRLECSLLGLGLLDPSVGRDGEESHYTPLDPVQCSTVAKTVDIFLTFLKDGPIYRLSGRRHASGRAFSSVAGINIFEV